MTLFQFGILASSAIVATFLTYFLSQKKGQGPVRSSALLALIIGGFFHFFPNLLPEIYTTKIPLFIIGGSFIGMVTTKTNVSYFSLFISPLIFSFLMLYMSRYFTGYGGALGTVACISLMCTMAFPMITKNKKFTYGYRLIKVVYKRRKRKLR